MSQTDFGTILIVDSDANISELLQVNLRSEGYAVRVIECAREVRPETLSDVLLVITDCMEQPFTGLDLVHDIKENIATMHIGVILYSKYKSQNMVIDALEAGADDYVVKPFSLSELLARTKAILRRSAARMARVAAPRAQATVHHQASTTMSQPENVNVLRFKTLNVNMIDKIVRDDDQQLALSKTEFALLVYLMRHVNNFVTRQELHRNIWNDDAGANDRIVDTNISRLRKKLGPYGNALVNRTGYGYMLTDR